MDPRGSHSLSCKKSASRQSRHSAVNDVVARAFARAGIPSVKEPPGLIPGSALRPDGATIISWASGHCLAWDVTYPDTLASSYVAAGASQAGAAAERAAYLKIQKYHQLSGSHSFAPLVFETMGPLSEGTLEILNRLGGILIARKVDPRERSFLFQNLSVAVQRGNASCFLNSIQHELGTSRWNSSLPE